MGFPYGADEDAAYIIAWLELNKLNGIKLLANSINQIDNKYNGGIIILDDYGIVEGETKGVDEFVHNKNIRIQKLPYKYKPSFIIKK